MRLESLCYSYTVVCVIRLSQQVIVMDKSYAASCPRNVQLLYRMKKSGRLPHSQKEKVDGDLRKTVRKQS